LEPESTTISDRLGILQAASRQVLISDRHTTFNDCPDLFLGVPLVVEV
jgi:hypothetical protein